MTSHRTGSTHPDEVRIGMTVEGRYHIVERLGEGGFATVFKAQDAIERQWVALKVLHANPRLRYDASFLARFEREARLAARIAHPSVVSILGHGKAGRLEQPYIVMEFLEGYDLDFMLEQEGRFDARRAMHLLMPCLEALGQGHAQGIVHKDLKPGNLFITHPGTPHEHMKVLDFGIARRDAADERKITRAGEVTGTPEYLAPEYINSALVTPALDVYQMGLILGEMLVGHPLVQADSPIGCVIAHTQGVRLPVEVLHTPLAEVLRCATALDPAERYPDAEAFRRALARISPDDAEAALSEAEITLSGRRIARPDTIQANPSELGAGDDFLVERPDTVQADPASLAAMGAFDPAALRRMLETADGPDDFDDASTPAGDLDDVAFGPTLGADGTGIPAIPDERSVARRETMAAAPGVVPPAPWLAGDDDDAGPTTQVPQIPGPFPQMAAFHDNATRPHIQPFQPVQPPAPRPGLDTRLLLLTVGGGMVLLVVIALVVRLLL